MLLPARNIPAEITGINKSNALLYLLILNEGLSINIFVLRVYELDNFEVHNTSYKRKYTIPSFMATYFFPLEEMTYFH